MTLLLAMLLAQSFPTSLTVRQGTGMGHKSDGGSAWAVECTNCSGGGGVAGGLTNTELRAGPVPMYLQDAGVLNVNPVGIASLPIVFIGDAGVLNVNFPASQAVTGTFWQSTQPVSLASAPTTPITAAALPLPSGAATDATLSQLLDGGVGLLSTIAANQTSGQRTQVTFIAQPLNPFLPRCNPVRRTGCQP